MRQDLIDITMVLDRSGSMSTIRDDTIGGFNTFLEAHQKAEGEALFTLVQFDHEYELVYDAFPVKKVEPLSNRTFVPRGNTALLDAIGRSIVATGERLSNMAESSRPSQVLFVILTDGMENSSREYTKEKINEMISHQRDAYRWEFVFLGANQDAIQTGISMGIAEAASMTYAANHVGTEAAFKSVSTNSVLYRQRATANANFNLIDREDQERAGAKKR